MQKRIYVELPKENGPRFYYRDEALQKVKEELQSFLELSLIHISEPTRPY